MVKSAKYVYYKCLKCPAEYHRIVRARIVENRLVPECDACGSPLIRRVKNECA